MNPYDDDFESYDGWRYNTRIIRQWVKSDTVSTCALLAQLKQWVEILEDVDCPEA